MNVVTRFAPSPTGYLHIGGARTALYCWLFARHHQGKFLLRIEDTDRQRSSLEAVDAIYRGMKWLGLDWDGDTVSQFAMRDRHAAVARQMLEDGKAYYCYCTPQELEEMREKARTEGKSFRYDRRWRDRDPSEAPAGVDPVIRIKAPLTGSVTLDDKVQGHVTVNNEELDDFVLLRSDGTPTYMLSVVVDDHDMGITHVIRGDDHLTNTFRQIVIYNAMGWDTPVFAHLPMIHGDDGAKLSKRHGALSVEEYEKMGYLAEAMRNYLLRLGWGHGDAEIISTEQAIEWFSLEGVGRAPARFDYAKLNNLNNHYMRQKSPGALLEILKPRLEERYGALNADSLRRLEAGLHDLAERATTLNELAESAGFYLVRPSAVEMTPHDRENLGLVEAALAAVNDNAFAADRIEEALKAACAQHGKKFKDLAMPLRLAVTGVKNSPSITHIAANLGREETLGRIRNLTG